ncbi:MAG TPA: hypothetical protein VL651_14060 [Bacteroidia bacterium]|jgi:hypothetical protein|nr:hypothetical protein [Bacteroidia bacterium]
MKNLITVLAVTTVLFLTSCDKQDLPTPSSTQPAAPVSTIGVTYKISSVSGHFDVTALTYENGVQKEVVSTFDRTNATLTFDAPAGSMLSIKAKNCIPAADEITVEIWVNGVVFKTNSADAPGSYAIAEGQY